MRNNTKKQIVTAIKNFNDACERVSGAYFWGDNGNASSRRYREKQLSKYQEFVYKGEKITCELNVEMSRKNTYTTISVYKGNEKKTRAIFKKILQDLGCENLEWMYAIISGEVYKVLTFKKDGEKIWFFDYETSKTKTGTFNTDIFKYQHEASLKLDNQNA